MENNEILKTAFKRYFDELHPYCPDAENKIVWNFTAEYHFEQKMDKLISSQKKSYWKYINTAGKRIAIVLVILSVMLSTAMSVNAFREPVVEFIVKTYEKFSSFLVDKNSALELKEELSRTIEIEMLPQNIPEGFIVSEKYNDNYISIMIWKNKENEYIEFYQYSAKVSTNTNTENVILSETSIDNITLYYYTQDNMTSYIWYDCSYCFVLNTPKHYTLEQAENIIKSVE